jgi:hypothetical protein
MPQRLPPDELLHRHTDKRRGGGRFDFVILDFRNRPRLEISPRDVDTRWNTDRHLGEVAEKCKQSRKWGDEHIADWNRAGFRDPIMLVEYNWLEDGTWKRSYGEITDGTHRIEVALIRHISPIWIAVAECRFLPCGECPTDRRTSPFTA